MTAAAKDTLPAQYDVPPSVLPSQLDFPLAAAVKVYGGMLAGTNASGNLLATFTAATKIWGVCIQQKDNTAGAAGDLRTGVQAGCFFLINDTTNAVTNAYRGQYVYAVDNQTVGTSDLGGTLPVAGYVVDVPGTGAVEYGRVAVMIGVARPDTSNPELNNSTQFKARVVMTSLGANTGTLTGTLTVTATGALGAQDGVTCVAGDIVFVQEGTTNLGAAADAGPYVISVIGTTGVSAVLTRPDWWPQGSTITQGVTIQIGGEGTGTNPTLAGTTWKTFCAKSKVVGTDAPVFWPGIVSCGVTLASGTLASARSTIPVRAALTTGFVISSNPATAPHANTRLWRVSALTPGVTGTASVQIVAESAPGTTNASDVGQYNIVAINW